LSTGRKQVVGRRFAVVIWSAGHASSVARLLARTNPAKVWHDGCNWGRQRVPMTEWQSCPR
jgi:hypothetical protein